ncbi:MAG TPA: 6,7-dimethyl-8-ribityllumazine synthase [Candidatus Dormibacteraeota bacterium]|nr:6,7-dimethyl-8-ribityllumazine synthase [Candidatus Dormibacteraeota bacterium]
MKNAEPHPLGGDGLAVAIVVARANDEDVARRLLKGAQGPLSQRGAGGKADVYWVPTVLDIPVVALALAEKGGPDAIVALASVVADDISAMQAIQGLMQVQLDTGVPIAIGILITEDKDQALAQSGPKNNKGAKAAEAAIEIAQLLREIQG